MQKETLEIESIVRKTSRSLRNWVWGREMVRRRLEDPPDLEEVLPGPGQVSEILAVSRTGAQELLSSTRKWHHSPSTVKLSPVCSCEKYEKRD